MTMPTFQSSLDFIRRAHADQNYGADIPFWVHPFSVANMVPWVYGAISETKDDQDLLMAALLHDVVEDTEYTLENLCDMGYHGRVVDIVGLVTRDKDNETYKEFIDKIAKSMNLDAMLVKSADLMVNIANSHKGMLPESKAGLRDRWLPAKRKIDETILMYLCTREDKAED